MTASATKAAGSPAQPPLSPLVHKAAVPLPSNEKVGTIAISFENGDRPAFPGYLARQELNDGVVEAFWLVDLRAMAGIFEHDKF